MAKRDIIICGSIICSSIICGSIIEWVGIIKRIRAIRRAAIFTDRRLGHFGFFVAVWKVLGSMLRIQDSGGP